MQLLRYTQRLTPVSATCTANLPEVISLCKRIIAPFFEDDLEKVYRVGLAEFAVRVCC